MGFTDCPGQPAFVGRRQDEMDVVKHQAIGAAIDGVPLELRGHKIEIDLFVARLEEDAFATIATLCYMVRNAENNHAGEAGHDDTSGC